LVGTDTEEEGAGTGMGELYGDVLMEGHISGVMSN